MLLFVKNERTTIYNYFFFPSRYVNRRVLRFINKRYKTSFDKNRFKTVQEMFNYILEREVESEQR
jgi:hypothetical protein